MGVLPEFAPSTCRPLYQSTLALGRGGVCHGCMPELHKRSTVATNAELVTLESAGKKPKIMAQAMEVDGGKAPGEIDESLHSRQLILYGKEAMQRMAASNILICGLTGLGAEVAKNVILAGVKSVTLFDPSPVEMRDLGAHFYLSPSDVGKPRAEACASRLQELNPAVAVSVADGDEVTEGLMLKHRVACFCSGGGLRFTNAQLIHYDNFCREAGIAFVKGETRGLFANIFCDLGPEFVVNDVDGEEAFSGILASIGDGTEALVTLVDDERISFQDGDMVTFKEVKGLEVLNDGKPRRIRDVNVRKNSFVLELTPEEASSGQYLTGGVVSQVKPTKTLSFRSLASCMEDPGEWMLSDFGKFDRPAQLHCAFRALDQLGKMPAPGDEAEAQLLVDVAKTISEKATRSAAECDLGDGEIVRHLARQCYAELNPMCCVFGGIAAQEILKAVSHKYHPIHQWFYFESLESLPTPLPPAAQRKPVGSRYDGPITVFGSEAQRRVQDAKVFLVGAGALGCEFLKNFALMGVSCDGNGGVTVTDDDTIEKSNLSRQFLFRDWNLGQAKSTCAAEAAQKINPGLKVTALQNRVSSETEEVFNDGFWEGLDVVVNALDNVNARLYVDSRCVYFQKPLLESGTLGTKCNTQMVIPHITENYGASRDPPEKQAPMCTLHSFPHNIDHCLTWARSEFEGLFEKNPAEAKAFLSKPDYIDAVRKADSLSQTKEALDRVGEILLPQSLPKTFRDCVEYARLHFEDYFANKIKQLTYTFPEDANTSTGAKFWSPPKRFPRAVAFDANDPVCLQFVHAGANLRAIIFGIPQERDPAVVASMCASINVPDFRPSDSVKIETDEKKTAPDSVQADEEGVNSLIHNLQAARSSLPQNFVVESQEFEKDDDSNFHMDFIAAAANLRARCYSIEEVDRLKAKAIAGRIIPAIATATALATGLVCLEFYKQVGAQVKEIEGYRNSFINLALPVFIMSEPIPPAKVEFNGMKWSMWDRWRLHQDVTVQGLMDWFQEKGLTVCSISSGTALIYNDFFPKHKERLPRQLSEVVQTVSKIDIPASRRHLDVVVICEDDDGEDVETPLVSIFFR